MRKASRKPFGRLVRGKYARRVAEATNVVVLDPQVAAVVLTPDTLRLAEGFVEVKPLGAMPIKGMAEPVEVYELPGGGPARTRNPIATSWRSATPSSAERVEGCIFARTLETYVRRER